MYNRYIPEDTSYTRIEPPPPPPPQRPGPGPRRQQPFRLPDVLLGKESSFLESLHLDKIDSGDLLLLLIALYLWKEGDDPDLAIALGLTLLMGLGEDGE